MITNVLGRTGLSFALILVLVTGFASAALAQYELPLTGSWYQNRGPLVDIPVNGGPGYCGPPISGTQMTGCVNGFKPNLGGIPATSNARVVATPGSTSMAPARMVFKPTIFAQQLGPQTTHVSIVPTVIQLDTDFSLKGPGSVGTAIFAPNTTAGGGMVTPVVGDRIFTKDAWMGQAGRLAANFTWCPGVGGPACPDPRPALNGNTGAENGLIRYTAGANGYGGTMNMLLGTVTNGAVWVIVATAGPTASVVFKQVLSGMGRQHPGGAYATLDTDNLMTGNLYAGFQTSMGGNMKVPGLTGPITVLGPNIGTNPMDNNSNWGFPWTTGVVYGQNVETNNGAPGTTTIALVGSDNRTQYGAGNITLVASGTSHRVGAQQNFVPADYIVVTLPEPGSVAMLAGSLVAIFGLYGLRRRF